jgi:hypothetical protein
MAINQTTVRQFLAAILLPGVDELEANKYIVPKQGNWFNPQDLLAGSSKPGTWCAYLLKNCSPRSIPYTFGVDGVQYSNVLYTGDLELQFVGDKSEILAHSVAHWLNRMDVIDYLEELYAQLMADGLGSIIVSNFYQDGDNAVLAYNVTIGLQWAENLETGATMLDQVTMSGGIN